MFVSTRDQGVGRKSRVYGVSKAARSSKLSLLSAASGISTTSTGSNSTITQDTYSRSRDHGRTRRRRKSDKRDVESVLTKSETKTPDVFDFLVDENTRRAVEPGVVEDSRDIITESDPENYYRGHSSDSGISMGSNAGEPGAATLPPLMEDMNEHVYSSASSVADCDCFQQDPHNGWQEYSGCYHCDPPSSSRRPSFVSPPDPSFVVPESNQTTSHSSTPIIFRDKSTSKSSPRLFRRFKRVNARSLLQMQARIAELEHELRSMDMRFTAMNLKKENAERPSQDDQMRRANIYRDLRVQLDQYYQALIATHQVQNITKAPTTQETQSFRKWIDSHVLNKISFFSDDADLICFRTPDRSSQPLMYRAIALSAFINLLIPLLLYKFLSGILNRLILWSIVIVAGATTMERLGLRAEKIYTTCIIAFGGISLGAALSLRG